jgi:hypothetical protein
MVRALTQAARAASSNVTILTCLPQALHQARAESLRRLITTMRSVSIVISIRFFHISVLPLERP